MEKPVVVYGSPLGNLLMAPKHEALRAKAIIYAFKNAKNWGDFRVLMPDDHSYYRYLRHSRHYTGPAKPDINSDLSAYAISAEVPFEAWDAYGDIDPENLPYYPEHEMLGWLPNEVIGMGKVVNLVRRDHIKIQVVLEFSRNDSIAILNKTRSLGYELEHDEELLREITAIDIDLRK